MICDSCPLWAFSCKMVDSVTLLFLEKVIFYGVSSWRSNLTFNHCDNVASDIERQERHMSTISLTPPKLYPRTETSLKLTIS